MSAYRGYEPGPSDPGILHACLVMPGMAWPAGDEVSLVLGAAGEAVRPRWRALLFEADGTVLLRDEAGVVLPYTRLAGDILPISAVAIVRAAEHGIAGQPTATSADLVLYGLR